MNSKGKWTRDCALRMPSAKNFILDELNQFPCKLVEEQFARGDVDNGELYATDVCACHRNVVHGINLADTFDVGGHLLAIFLADGEALLVALYVKFFLHSKNQCLVSLGCIEEGVD